MLRFTIILLFLTLMGCKQHEQVSEIPPFRIIDHLYYLGFQGHKTASYLIATSQGLILINSGFEADLPQLKHHIEQLGFSFNDIKIILISQAHSDHDAASSLIKSMTHAQYMVMEADVAVVESGGRQDFQYHKDPEDLYPAVKVDRVLHDGDTVRLGNTVLTARLTPGHTKGCTTWLMKAHDNHQTYQVVIVGGTSVNPGYDLIHNQAYPQIASDYRKMWQVLKAIPCDIFLGAHGGYFDLDNKYQHMSKEGRNVFIDPLGYRHYIDQMALTFNHELEKQRSAASTPILRGAAADNH